MTMLECPFCGREIQKGAHFCSWCGATLPESVKQNSSEKHEWPEEEKSVTFTIYEANPSEIHQGDSSELGQSDLLESAQDDSSEIGQTAVTTRWSTKHVVVVLFIVLIGALIVLFVSFRQSSQDPSRMPDYQRVVERQQQKMEKEARKQEEQRQDAMRIEDELRRQREAEERAKAEAQRQAEEELMDYDEMELENRIRDLINSSAE